MNLYKMYEEMKSNLECDLFELVDDYDKDGNRISIFKDETVPGQYVVYIEFPAIGEYRRCGHGVKTCDELEHMSFDEFVDTVNVINYHFHAIN